MREWSRKTLFLNYHFPLPISYKFWGFFRYGRTWQNWHFCPFWELPLRQQTFLKAGEIQWASVSAVLVVHVHSSGALRHYWVFSSSCCFMWRRAFKLYLLLCKHIFHVVEAAPSSCIAPFSYWYVHAVRMMSRQAGKGTCCRRILWWGTWGMKNEGGNDHGKLYLCPLDRRERTTLSSKMSLVNDRHRDLNTSGSLCVRPKTI